MKIDWNKPIECKMWGSMNQDWNHDWEDARLQCRCPYMVEGWMVNDDGTITTTEKQIGEVRNKEGKKV